MKRKDLLLLTFLLSQTAPLWAMEDSERINTQIISHRASIQEEDRNPIAKVRHLQQSLLNVMHIAEISAAQYKDSEKVFLIGQTGSGKSTMINLLLGNKIFSDGEGRLDTQNPAKGSEIGHDIRSKTILPSLSEGPDNIILGDLAGQHDSGGPENDIINLCAAHKLFVGPCKFLVAVSETSLTNRASEFLDILNQLTKTIPVEQLKGSLALVVTKQGLVRYSNPHRKLKEIIGAFGVHALTDDVKELLLHLTEEDHIQFRVPFFPCPRDIDCDYDVQEPREKILDSIHRLTSVLDPTVQLQLPPETMLYITQLAQDLNKEVEDSIQYLTPKIIHLCQTQCTNYRDDAALEELKDNLMAVKVALHFLQNATLENIEGFSVPLNRFFDQGEPNIIKDCIQTLKFLKTLEQEITYSDAAWSQALQSTIDHIHRLIDDLAHILGTSITDYATKTVNQKIITFCTNVLNTTPREEDTKLQNLSKGKELITQALDSLREEDAEHLNNFADLFNEFFDENEPNGLRGPMGKLIFLTTLKEGIKIPTAEWLEAIQPSLHHIQSLIGQQEDIIQHARIKAAEEEAARQAREKAEEAARLEREETTRKAEEQHQAHLAEVARLAEVAAAIERQRLVDLEMQRQTQALLQQQLAQQQAQAEATERQRLADLEVQRQEEAARRVAEEAERQALERERQEEERKVVSAILEAQRQTQELLQQQLAQQQEEQERLAAESRRYKNQLAIAAEAEADRKAQEEEAKRIAAQKIEDERNAALTAEQQRLLNLPKGVISKADYDLLPEDQKGLYTNTTRKMASATIGVTRIVAPSGRVMNRAAIVRVSPGQTVYFKK